MVNKTIINYTINNKKWMNIIFNHKIMVIQIMIKWNTRMIFKLIFIINLLKIMNKAIKLIINLIQLLIKLICRIYFYLILQMYRKVILFSKINKNSMEVKIILFKTKKVNNKKRILRINV
jgi:hypothetical protein